MMTMLYQRANINKEIEIIENQIEIVEFKTAVIKMKKLTWGTQQIRASKRNEYEHYGDHVIQRIERKKNEEKWAEPQRNVGH